MREFFQTAISTVKTLQERIDQSFDAALRDERPLSPDNFGTSVSLVSNNLPRNDAIDNIIRLPCAVVPSSMNELGCFEDDNNCSKNDNSCTEEEKEVNSESVAHVTCTGVENLKYLSKENNLGNQCIANLISSDTTTQEDVMRYTGHIKSIRMQNLDNDGRNFFSETESLCSDDEPVPELNDLNQMIFSDLSLNLFPTDDIHASLSNDSGFSSRTENTNLGISHDHKDNADSSLYQDLFLVQDLLSSQSPLSTKKESLKESQDNDSKESIVSHGLSDNTHNINENQQTLLNLPVNGNITVEDDQTVFLTTELQKALDILSLENEKLKMELLGARSYLELSSVEHNNVLQQLTALKQHMSLVQSDLQIAENLVDELTEKEKVNETVIASLNESIAMAQNKNKELTMNNHKLHDDYSVLRGNFAALSNELNNAKSLSKSAANQDVYTDEIISLRRKNEQLKNLQQSTQFRLEAVEKQLEQIELQEFQSGALFKEERDALKQEIIKLETQNMSIEAPLSQKIWLLEKTIRNLETKLRDTNSTVQQRPALNIGSIVIDKKIYEELIQLEEKINIIEKQHCSEKTTLDQELMNKDSKIHNLQTQLEEINAKYRSTDKRLRSSQERILQLEETNDMLTTQIDNSLFNKERKHSLDHNKDSQLVKKTNNDTLLPVLQLGHPPLSPLKSIGPSISKSPIRCASEISLKDQTHSDPNDTFFPNSPLATGPTFNVLGLTDYTNISQKHTLSIIQADVNSVMTQNKKLENECLRLTATVQQLREQLALNKEIDHSL